MTAGSVVRFPVFSSGETATDTVSPSAYTRNLTAIARETTGLSSIPLALVPTNGASIHMKNPQNIKEELRKVTEHFQLITEVRQFGRGGILCCSPDQACVSDLLKCTSFASLPCAHIKLLDVPDNAIVISKTTQSFWYASKTRLGPPGEQLVPTKQGQM